MTYTNYVPKKYGNTLPTPQTIYARQYYLKNKTRKKEYYTKYYNENKHWIRLYRSHSRPKLPSQFTKEDKIINISFE